MIRNSITSPLATTVLDNNIASIFFSFNSIAKIKKNAKEYFVLNVTTDSIVVNRCETVTHQKRAG